MGSDVMKAIQGFLDIFYVKRRPLNWFLLWLPHKLIYSQKPIIFTCLEPLMLLGTLEMKQISKMSSLSVVNANLPSFSIFSLVTEMSKSANLMVVYWILRGYTKTKFAALEVRVNFLLYFLQSQALSFV